MSLEDIFEYFPLAVATVRARGTDCLLRKCTYQPDIASLSRSCRAVLVVSCFWMLQALCGPRELPMLGSDIQSGAMVSHILQKMRIVGNSLAICIDICICTYIYIYVYMS